MVALRPEAVLLLKRRVCKTSREDDELGFGIGVVVDGVALVTGHAHGGLRAGLKDLVGDLESHRSGDHEVDLLLAGVAVAVAAASARAGRHSPPAERHLLGTECVAVPALLAVAGVAGHEVECVLAAGDRVSAGLLGAHLMPPVRLRPTLAALPRHRGCAGLHAESA